MDKYTVNVVRKVNTYMRDELLTKSRPKGIHVHILSKSAISRKMKKKILIQIPIHQREL